ncbi:hypothetical protein GW17_00034586 [Ensete ventricosum]|nr:hypothetical protein GW17_00034586 [Ensete ventricosum]
MRFNQAPGLKFELPGVGLGIDGRVWNDFQLFFSFRLCPRAALVVQRKVRLLPLFFTLISLEELVRLSTTYKQLFALALIVSTFLFRALYQLHLVKADIARALIPNKLKLVEAFGYHLICLVVIPGIVWSPPTSCA